jgi:hypothetical protein
MPMEVICLHLSYSNLLAAHYHISEDGYLVFRPLTEGSFEVNVMVTDRKNASSSWAFIINSEIDEPTSDPVVNQIVITLAPSNGFEDRRGDGTEGQYVYKNHAVVQFNLDHPVPAKIAVYVKADDSSWTVIPVAEFYPGIRFNYIDEYSYLI